MKTQNKKSTQSRNYAILAGIVLLILSFLFISRKQSSDVTSTSVSDIETPIEKDEENLQVIPDSTTQFFSEDGKALLWYSKVNDSIVIYQSQVDGIDMQPVTDEIASLYNKKEEIAEVKVTKPKKPFKNIHGEVLKRKKKPVIEKKIVRESIWNETQKNLLERDEVSLFVFNQTNQIDTSLSQRFKNEFLSKDYYITDQIIYSDVMTNEIANNLKNKNLEYFNGKLKEHTDYICIATASYAYSENEYRNDFLDCTMTLNYFIYSTENGEIMLSEKDKIIGSGQTKKTSKKDAIEKFIL